MIRLERIDSGEGGRESRDVALLLLDRREKRNALTPDMLENIRVCVDRVHEESPRPGALVLAGEGEVLCAGFDLSLCRDDTLAMPALLTRLSEATQALRRLPIPVVAAAHGAAIAGGCALIAGADFIVTDARAKLGYPVVRLGVSPAVSAPLLALHVGAGHSRERQLDPSLIDGREALRIGLADACVESPEQVRGRAIEIAAALCAKPPHALAATKRWLNELDGSDDDQLSKMALDASLSIAGGPDERERLAALWKG